MTNRPMQGGPIVAVEEKSRGEWAQKKKKITFKAGMYMKTNKNMTICPHQKAKVLRKYVLCV